MRKLASIQKIENIRPIDGSDFIEQGNVLGWNMVIKKGEFKDNDLVVFIEPDSVLPEKPEFEFLRDSKFRIKTRKIRKTISQGICFPLSILPQDKKYNIDDDVTLIIGIKQYEPTMDVETEDFDEEYIKKFQHPIFKFLFRYGIFRKLLLTKKQDKGFPKFISKTDETRIQLLPHILDNKDNTYTIREKLNGQSGSFFLQKMRKKWFRQKQNYDFGVCSRNLRQWIETNSSFWFVANKYNIRSVLESLIGEHNFVVIQGECIGSKIQGNKYKVKEPDLYVFNLIYPSGKVNCLKGEEILKKYGMKWCPLVAKDFVLPDNVNEILEYSTGQSALGNGLREGLVFRSYVHNISFKVVSPEYLIKNDE